VIGTLIDISNKEIMFWRNNKFLGVAFSNIETGKNRAYFPAISMEKGMRVAVNFGQSPLRQTINSTVLAINEPDCHINGYYNASVQLIEQFKNYIMAF